MRRTFLTLSLLGSLIFLFPAAALASSCGCLRTTIVIGDTPSPSCESKDAKNADYTSDSCAARNSYYDSVLHFTYSNCVFYPSTDNCTDPPPKNEPGIKPIDLKSPQLEISIPGLSFPSDLSLFVDTEGNIHVPWLGIYLSAVYKFLIGAGSLVAVIVIILNGFRISISSGGPEKNEGIKHITQAVTGLVILWGSYAVLFTINPNLVQFKSISVSYVTIPSEEDEEEISASPQEAATTTNLVEPTGGNLYSKPGVQVSETLLAKLKVAAKTLAGQGIVLLVTDGYRTMDQQVADINKNCQNPPGSPTCNHKDGRPTTCMLVGNDPKNCPHTTGKAVDVWGMQNGSQCIKQAKCHGSNPATDPCRLNDCQAAVIKAMDDAEFCNLSSEAWHFEFPKMSSKCTY